MLVSAAIAGAAARGCRAYRAVGDDLGQQLPLRALLDALGEHVTTDATQHQLADSAGIVAGGAAVPAGVERLLVAVDRLCATAPLVLAFDDLQWADEGSLLAWHRLSLAVDQIPLLLVSACRPVPVRPP